MSARAFEFLLLTWALGALVVYTVHEDGVLAYKAEQRAARFTAIRSAIRTVDPAKLYAPAVAPGPPVESTACYHGTTDAACYPLGAIPPTVGGAFGGPFGAFGYCTGPMTDEGLCTEGSYDEHVRQLDELERRLRDLYIRELFKRGEAWAA